MVWRPCAAPVYKVLCILLLYYLVVSTPRYQEKPCPHLSPLNHIRQGQNLAHKEQVDCPAIFAGDAQAIERASQFTWCQRDEALSDYSYLKLAANCDIFKESRGYATQDVTQEEVDFPLAFSILMYENVEQFERLLYAIYRPQNVYCVHVDVKSSYFTHRAVQAISKCFHNVFVASNLVDIHWGEFSLLEAELSCVRDLWNSSVKWQYYINLTGREYPLKTNHELVQILKAYNGANDVDGTLHK